MPFTDSSCLYSVSLTAGSWVLGSGDMVGGRPGDRHKVPLSAEVEDSKNSHVMGSQKSRYKASVSCLLLAESCLVLHRYLESVDSWKFSQLFNRPHLPLGVPMLP